MKTIYLDCQAGISGDMTVAALLDLGVPLDYLRAELAKLGLPDGSYKISSARTERRHVTALSFGVAVHDHHTHRHYAGIDALIAASGLADSVKCRSRRIFRRLAEAEALVHGVAVEDVHFHEVGAVDSIVDIVGAAICLDYLDVEQLFVSALPLGSGFVETAHGRLALPAPATAELLKGFALHGECGPGERVTPTGAAIVAALAVPAATRPLLQLERIGCGAGNSDFPDCPNVLRAMLGSAADGPAADGPERSGLLVVESNIDDSTPEVLGYTMERLLEQGALDVWFVPIQMKKNRPGVTLAFLCRQEQLEQLAGLVLTETSAIGLRHFPVSRIVLERLQQELATPWGNVRLKLLYRDGLLLRSSPEYEDCRRIAREQGIPCRQVMERVVQLAQERAVAGCE